MAITYLGAKKLLESHVVELSFSRRNIKKGWPRNRRMLCTNSYKLLGSLGGRMGLNFRVPANFPAYDAKSLDLITTWDIFMQDFRSIPLEAIFVIGAYPVSNQKQIDEFWSYFDQAVRPMTSSQKTKFMKT
jgi:hypothetical protein